jgi:hypothetical protein
MPEEPTIPQTDSEFASLDKDNDGKLTLAEFNPALPASTQDTANAEMSVNADPMAVIPSTSLTSEPAPAVMPTAETPALQEGQLAPLPSHIIDWSTDGAAPTPESANVPVAESFPPKEFAVIPCNIAATGTVPLPPAPYAHTITVQPPSGDAFTLIIPDALAPFIKTGSTVSLVIQVD